MERKPFLCLHSYPLNIYDFTNNIIKKAVSKVFFKVVNEQLTVSSQKIATAGVAYNIHLLIICFAKYRPNPRPNRI